MRSGWFWGTEMWARYLQSYAEVHPDCLKEYRSSPLVNDHYLDTRNHASPSFWNTEIHQTQVIDLRLHQWGDIRKSYHSLINKAMSRYVIGVAQDTSSMHHYQLLHAAANGRQPRPDATYECQQKWLHDGNALLVSAVDGDGQWFAAAYWIVYKDAAYYMSGPSVAQNVQHAVIWHSLQVLKDWGVQLVELGQIDGETKKERNIGIFKQGFGGEARPFTIVKRVS